jgi:acetolactate synthase-1/2/3 large subunit
VPIVGDARNVLRVLNEELSTTDLSDLHGHASDWMEHIREMQHKHQPKQSYMLRPETSQLMPADVYEVLTQAINSRGDYRVVTDVGQHQMWAAQLIDWFRPRTHITSGGAGTMGFAVPAALGVAMAHPGDTVWAICGDGGFQMTNQEMQTIMQEGLKNVKVAVINNGYLGMVRQWQELFENKRYSGTPLSGPDFARLAEAYGWKGITVERVEDVEAAIEEAYATDGPVLIDFRVEREVNVWPMVPQGKSIGETITDATQV